MPFPFDMQANGNLRVYTQFPRFYPAGLNEMIEQLPDIKNMGFNSVWVNPIQETGKVKVKRRVGRRPIQVSGSLYAMYNNNTFNPAFQVDENLVKHYTAEARRLELIPLFDLVLNQIACDENSPLYELYQEGLFRKPPWDDTLRFKYEDINFREKVVEELWKPYIHKYIADYGFMGVRVDAVKHLPREVQIELYRFIQEQCHHYHNCKAVILGELLDKNPLKYVERLTGLGLTHVNNSSFWANFSFEHRLRGVNQEYSWLLEEMGKLRNIIYTENIEARGLGGTVGYTGNHDLISLGVQARDREANESISLETKLREHILGVALSSDSGWYLLAGDEFGAPLKHKDIPIVFELPAKYRVTSAYNEKWGSEYDLRSWIAGINHVLARLPGAGLYSYIEHLATAEYPHLAIIIRHDKSTDNDESEEINIICANLDKEISINHDHTYDILMEKIRDRQVNINAIYLLDSNICYQLTSNGVVQEQQDFSNLDNNHHYAYRR